MPTKPIYCAADKPRAMTVEQLRLLGTSVIVYAKPILCDGERFFMIHSASGMPLEATDSMAAALERAATSGFGLAMLH